MPAPFKPDFIHVGYHKTASTWLQMHVFPRVPGLLMCNDGARGLERPFYESFVFTDPFRFDKDRFLDSFSATVERAVGDLSCFPLIGLSEENLSGDPQSGMEARTLADRLYETFGPTRILIVVRNQIDMLLSIYSNYVVHGGIAPLPDLVERIHLGGARLVDKLKYSGLIEYYRALYGAGNVHVVFFEQLIKERPPLQQFFRDLGVSGELPSGAGKGANLGRSLPANRIMRQLNRFGVSTRYGHHLARLVAPNDRTADRQQIRKAFPRQLAAWREDNSHLAGLLATELPAAYSL